MLVSGHAVQGMILWTCTMQCGIDFILDVGGGGEEGNFVIIEIVSNLDSCWYLTVILI